MGCVPIAHRHSELTSRIIFDSRPTTPAADPFGAWCYSSSRKHRSHSRERGSDGRRQRSGDGTTHYAVRS
ncbi:hypothetical protein KCP75_22840 [Salmonella enterica subsp. enterica]|nr:hypothetical protein KCP75_22840 [Salmonella enterica subsp. enterica]